MFWNDNVSKKWGEGVPGRTSGAIPLSMSLRERQRYNPSTKAGSGLMTAPETLALEREVPMGTPITDVFKDPFEHKSRTLSFASALFLSVLLGLSYSASAQDAKSVLQSAAKAMGDVNSIGYSGTGQLGYLGQAYSPGSPWPLNNITAYERTIDYPSRSSREELTV